MVSTGGRDRTAHLNVLQNESWGTNAWSLVRNLLRISRYNSRALRQDGDPAQHQALRHSSGCTPMTPWPWFENVRSSANPLFFIFYLLERELYRYLFQKMPKVEHLGCMYFSVSVCYFTTFKKWEKQKQIRTDQRTSWLTPIRWFPMDENVCSRIPCIFTYCRPR